MSSLEELPYSDRMFDAIVSTDVLEHVLRLDRAVDQLLRVLKPGGVLIVRVPNDENLSGYLGADQEFEFSHVRKFDLASLKLYFEKTRELEFLEHHYSGWLFGSASQLKHRLPGIADPLWQKLDELDQDERVQRMKAAFGLSDEEFIDDLIYLRDHRPEIATELMPDLVSPLDITVVFRKPDGQEEKSFLTRSDDSITSVPSQGFSRPSRRARRDSVAVFLRTFWYLHGAGNGCFHAISFLLFHHSSESV